MPPEITRLVHQFLKDPERIEVAPPATAAKTITQRFVFCPNGEDWAKREMLRKLIAEQNVKNAIIFCNRKVEVAILHRSLVKHGFSAGALHGDMDQKNRTETLDKFRAGDLMLLAASDVAARGLDIPDVSHIFNFDLPWQPDDYVHRIGRTGRAGKEGCSTSLVTADELKSLRDIEKMLGEEVVWIGAPPTPEDYSQAGKKRGRRGGRVAPRGRSAAPSGRGEGKPRQQSERRPPAAARAPEAAGEDRAEPKTTRRQQEPRRSEQQPSEPRAPRAQEPRRSEAQPQRRSEQREHRSEHAGNGHAANGQAANAQPPNRQPRAPKPRPERANGDHQQQGQRTGFADNVPAFMRKSVKRPVKVAGE